MRSAIKYFPEHRYDIRFNFMLNDNKNLKIKFFFLQIIKLHL